MAETNQQDSKSGLVRVMGLWENSDRRGNKYLSGNLTQSVRVMVFRNNYKQEGGRDPDYIVYISQRTPDERGGAPADAASQTQQPQAGHQQIPEDDIPF